MAMRFFLVMMFATAARPALQAMLADRFELKVHGETRQGQIYSLTIAKGGPKMKEHTGEGQAGISASVGGSRNSGNEYPYHVEPVAG